MKKTNKCCHFCEIVKPQEVQNAENTLVNSQSWDLQYFVEYLRNRALVTELLQRYYIETITNYLIIYPLRRKLKPSKCIRRQKASEDMVIKLKSKFGNDAVFVMDNYSTLSNWYQEPVRDIEFKRRLKKQRF